ncbi:DHA2 family efflux MFS transporter permease subunit [Myxococcaceae bacterium JPH2]|nr:DHA2 family efflux MFS transporter permease subunit [Myxococcaceae bacterium JPH2]
MSTAPAPTYPANKWLITASVSFGTLMAAIDASIVNVALSQIRASVGATTQEITWASTSYSIATVMVMPLSAFLGRMFGQKRSYLTCLALFIGGSFLCGLAWSLPVLILFRFIQGLGAGALPPTEQAILRQTFPPEEQAMAMALFTMVITVGPAVGPTLGGYIVDNFHWSWIFFINLPLGFIGLLMVGRFVEEPEDVRLALRTAAEEQRRNMDWSGIILMCVGMASLQFVFEEGQSHDWFESPEIVAVALVAAVALPAFVLRELTAPVPAVNLRLFKDPVFTSGTVLGGLMFFILVSSMFLLPLFMQELLGFTAMQSGLALMPRTLVMIVTMPIVGRLYSRVPPQVLISSGLLIAGLGVYRCASFTLDTGAMDIVIAIFLQGLGTSLLFVPLNTVAFDGIPRPKLADASGLNTLLRQLSSSVGLAVFAALLARYTAQAHVGVSAQLASDRTDVLDRVAQYQASFMAKGMDALSAHEASLRLLAGSALRQATVLAFDKLFLLGALLFLLAVPLMLFLRTAPKVAASVPTPTPEPPKAHVDVEI